MTPQLSAAWAAVDTARSDFDLAFARGDLDAVESLALRIAHLASVAKKEALADESGVVRPFPVIEPLSTKLFQIDGARMTWDEMEN